jgi:hypothetical protein
LALGINPGCQLPDAILLGASESRPRSRAAGGITPAQYKSEASQHGSSLSCELGACRTRQGYRCNPVTLPILPKVGPRLRGAFALSYGSDLLPLGDAFSLQAVDSVFRAHCFSKETYGLCHVLGRMSPHLVARFRCTDVIPVAFDEI